MSQLPPTEPGVAEAAFGDVPTPAHRVYAHTPEIARAYFNFGAACREYGTLPFRLVELVRLRVAFHNQCKLCMSMRYANEDGESVDEVLVCSLDKPYEAPDLTDAERAALAYADLMAKDHLNIDERIFAELRRHLSTEQVMELCFRVAGNVGFGRMAAVLDLVPQEDLPPELRGDGVVAPWNVSGKQASAGI